VEVVPRVALKDGDEVCAFVFDHADDARRLVLEVLLVELHFGEILKNMRNLRITVHSVMWVLLHVVFMQVLRKLLLHVIEKEGQRAESEQVESHHDVPKEQD